MDLDAVKEALLVAADRTARAAGYKRRRNADAQPMRMEALIEYHVLTNSARKWRHARPISCVMISAPPLRRAARVLTRAPN